MLKVIYTNHKGRVSVYTPYELSAADYLQNRLPVTRNEAGDIIHQVVDAEIVDSSEIPTDRTFRNAWVKDAKTINHDMDKCKIIAHDIRRSMRDEEMEPWDEMAKEQSKIPESEIGKSPIRIKYAEMQVDIDDQEVTTPEALKTILGL